MGFASGTISCRRFAVIGEHSSAIDQALLDNLAENALRESEMGLPEEIEYGWSGGRHVLDGAFSFEHNVYADALHFALRIDTNKVPGELKRAWQVMEEESVAAGNPSGFISKLQKRDVKTTIGRKVDEELRTGRFRRSKLLPVLWDLPGRFLYCAASAAAEEKLLELFQRTFGLELEPLSAGSLARRILETRGRRRDFEDARPTRFVSGPDSEDQLPEYPWVLKGPQPKDFLGNEFLLWLWHESETRNGIIDTEAVGQATVFIDKFLDLDCAYGASGRDSLRGTGPSRMPEARDALRTGKLPRRLGLVVHAQGQQYELGLSAEPLAVASAKLPDVPEAEEPRVLFEERIALLRDLGKALDAMYESFLKVRASGAWEGHAGAMRRWITHAGRPMAAVA